MASVHRWFSPALLARSMLLLTLGVGQGSAGADLITVDDTTCTLPDALATAVTDLDLGGCVQTPSATVDNDTLVILTFPTFEASCGNIPTTGCKVNGVPNQPCIGTPGDDSIVGTPGPDVILGLGGNDILKGGKGDDCLDGGEGDDRLEGSDGIDVLFGEEGNNRVRGGKGSDFIVVGRGDNTVQGDEGADLIVDHGGQNQIKGGKGDLILHLLGPDVGPGPVVVFSEDVFHSDSPTNCTPSGTVPGCFN